MNMKKLITTTFFSLLLVGFAETSSAQWRFFGPSDYDECILDGMKGVTSDLAARAIIVSCRGKFPSKTNTTRSGGQNLTSNELSNVKNTGRSWSNYFSSATFDIYNGNDFGISNVLVVVAITNESEDPRFYEYDIGNSCIGRKSSSSKSVDTFRKPTDSAWTFRILSAKKC